MARCNTRSADPVDGADAVTGLAAQWSAVCPSPSPALAARLAVLLGRLATVVQAEPFFPRGARAIGAELPATGLAGDPESLPRNAADALPPTLRLLRDKGPAVLGLDRPIGEQRLLAALDELAAGFAGALAETAYAGPDVMPPPAVVDAASAVTARHLRAFYEQSPVGSVITTLDGYVLHTNRALAAMVGLTGATGRPRSLSELVHPDDLTTIAEGYHRLVRGTSATLRLDVRLVGPQTSSDVGTVIRASLVASLVRRGDGTPSHVMIGVEDAGRREPRAQREEASADGPLARPPGRSLAEAWLVSMIERHASSVGLCSLDLDGFQAVVDAHGDAVAGRVLLGVAARLRLVAGRDHLVVRSGRAAFTVCVAGPAHPADVGQIADRLLGALAPAFVIDGHVVRVSASIGVVESGTAVGSGTAAAAMGELMRAADLARTWAQAMGGGRRVVYDPAHDVGEADRYSLLAALPRAIGAGQFRLVYQPLVGLADGHVRGAEALVRWQHPEQGLIGPGRFIPPAEESGAIVELGRWILATACVEAARWHHELGADAPYVSVNVSPVQLVEPGWADEVIAVLERTGLPAALLQLEITEQAVLGDGSATLDGLVTLSKAGVRLALDDFGTGWSSLTWLRRLPVHALKIDGSFIDGLRHVDADPVDAAIVESLIGMAHALGLEITAEWVETQAQAQRLAALGCDLGQGRWFADAGPGEWVPRWRRRSIDS